LVVVGVIVGISGLLGVGLAFTTEWFLVAEGSRAPAFTATRLDTDDTLHLSSYGGKVVLLNIWATWCGPCEQEMPSLERLYQQLGSDEFQVVAVSVDNAPSDEVLEWVTERNLTFDILHDRSGRIERDYQTTGLPETFIIDQQGVIVRKVIGAAEWDQGSQKSVILRLLGISEADIPDVAPPPADSSAIPLG
ncbi:MAG: TlpA disulfide reductase family protein, partial [Gemmatimonadales bacterium]